MGMACSMNGRHEKFISSVGQKTKGKRPLGSHGPGWADNTKTNLKYRMDENKCQNFKREWFIHCFRCSNEINYMLSPPLKVLFLLISHSPTGIFQEGGFKD
jgi:hypothetical protein